MGRIAAALLIVACASAQAAADASLDKLLASTGALAKEVSKIRGLKLKKPIPQDVVDEAELRKRLLAMAAEDKSRKQTLGEGLMMKRWGMLPQNTDYEALLVDLLTEQIAGYYDPETKKLTISQTAGKDAMWAELVLAHELDHGLQDQAFDLQKYEDLPDGSDDALNARHAVVEGDGIALMIELMLARKGQAAPWSNPEVATMLEKGMSVPGEGADKFDKAPLAVREGLIFPYQAGIGFVAALRRSKPWSAVDAAFTNPPLSTEQVMHPDRYFAGDLPIEVTVNTPPSLADWKTAHSTVWGELGFSLFLRANGIDAGTAALGAEGWGGDRVVTLERDGKTIGFGRFDWDSEVDAIEAEEAAVKALDSTVKGTLVRTQTTVRWMTQDGTVSVIDRKGPQMVMANGVPPWLADQFATEMWIATGSRDPKRGADPAAKLPAKKKLAPTSGQ
ncbi:MAG TPA: hypothetical protein VGM90_12580 [Kofleriaceae bacterium]|jgi:hypothetical protein